MRKAKRLLEKHLEQVDVRVGGSRPWDVTVHNDRFFLKIIRDGAFGSAESYMDHWWDCDRLDELAARVLRLDFLYGMNRGPRLASLLARVLLFNVQSGTGGQAVAKAHYDIGNDLYRAMLGPTMNYSCAYWEMTDQLDTAQRAKMDLICRKLKLNDRDRVLDVGCGWGGLAKHMATKYGSEVVGITISRQQYEYAAQHCSGLPVDIRLLDYRDPKLAELGPFNHIASIGMFEHVGHKNHRRFIDLCNRLLPDHGILLLQTFGRMAGRAVDPWVQKYIFPNSYIPSIGEIGRVIRGRFVMEDWHSFGADYDRTLMAWHRQFEEWATSNWKLTNPRCYRMWRYYLLTFAGCFRVRNRLQLWQLVLAKNGIPGGYISIR